MTRYQVLRYFGCDPIAACFVATMNWLYNVPTGLVKFMTFEIEYDTVQETHKRKMCSCGAKYKEGCDYEWGPSCDLGNNEKYVKVHKD